MQKKKHRKEKTHWLGAREHKKKTSGTNRRPAGLEHKQKKNTGLLEQGDDQPARRTKKNDWHKKKTNRLGAQRTRTPQGECQPARRTNKKKSGTRRRPTGLVQTNKKNKQHKEKKTSSLGAFTKQKKKTAQEADPPACCTKKKQKKKEDQSAKCTNKKKAARRRPTGLAHKQKKKTGRKRRHTG